MFDIQGILVSLDVVERMFCCDLTVCKGQCCIDGDAGAPVTPQEVENIESILPVIKPYLLPGAIKEIEQSGVSYIDEEGDLVTSIVNGCNCVFTCYDSNGICLCAIEKAWREGKTDVKKPVSCALYPLRVKEYPNVTVVNYHDWKICKCAKKLGREKGLRVYQFLKDPLIQRFGKEWYDELVATCELYLATYPDGIDRTVDQTLHQDDV